MPPQQGLKGLQPALIRAIEALKPAPEVVPTKVQTLSAEIKEDAANTPTWPSQLQQELVALQQGTPAETANVKTVIEGVLKRGEGGVAYSVSIVYNQHVNT